MSDLPGRDTIGIVSYADSGQVDALNEALQTESVTWVYGCVFEPLDRGPIEEQSDTITSAERAWAFLPYLEGVTTAITNANWLRPQRPDPIAQRDYKVLGLPEIEYDMDGQPDHVFITCEWHGG